MLKCQWPWDLLYLIDQCHMLVLSTSSLSHSSQNFNLAISCQILISMILRQRAQASVTAMTRLCNQWCDPMA